MKKSTTGLDPDIECLLPKPGELLYFRDNTGEKKMPGVDCWSDGNLDIPYGSPALVYRAYLNDSPHMDEPYYCVDVIVCGSFSSAWQLTAFDGLEDIPVFK